MQSGNISKTRKEKCRKGAWPWSCDPQNFGIHPNVSPNRVEVDISNLVYKCRVAMSAMSQKPAKKNSEKGRGLGHVTPRNFGVPPNLYTKRVELDT